MFCGWKLAVSDIGVGMVILCVVGDLLARYLWGVSFGNAI